MGGLECVITGIVDEFGDNFKRWHLSRRLVTLLIVTSSFLVALISLTPVRSLSGKNSHRKNSNPPMRAHVLLEKKTYFITSLLIQDL